MGIKNIHIFFISVAILISLIFGMWGMRHDYSLLGIISLVFALGMIVYGLSFLKKVKSL